jgi:hypothetical protein
MEDVPARQRCSRPWLTEAPTCQLTVWRANEKPHLFSFDESPINVAVVDHISCETISGQMSGCDISKWLGVTYRITAVTV